VHEKIYHSYFGSPNFYIPFLEPNINRIKQHMMPLLVEMTVKHKHLRRSFLFGVQHSFTSQYSPSGHRLTEPYWVVGENGEPTTFSLVS
jgi:hypothetical protein